MNYLFLFVSLTVHTITNAQDWYQVISGTTKTLNTIDFPSETIGYIGGNDSLLLKTINGGKTWDKLNYSGVNFIESGSDDNIINLNFINDTLGYMSVGPYSNGIYKTIDGGLTWNLVISMVDDLCFNYGLYFFADNDGFLGGSDCFTGEQIHRISESGTAPTTIIDLPPSGAMVTSIDFLDDLFGLAVGGYNTGGSVLKTIDGGLTWNTIETDFDPALIFTEILIINEDTAYLGYNNLELSFGLFESTDGGETWNHHGETSTFLYPSFKCLHQANNSQIYTGGGTMLEPHGVIFESNLEEAWWNIYSVDQIINSITSYGSSTVWAVGDSGYVIVNKNPELLEIPKINAADFDFQIAPNPSSTQLNIIADPHTVKLIEIQNILGQTIHKGNDLNIDIHNFQNGVYFVTLIDYNSNHVTKRFIKI